MVAKLLARSTEAECSLSREIIRAFFRSYESDAYGLDEYETDWRSIDALLAHEDGDPVAVCRRIETAFQDPQFRALGVTLEGIAGPIPRPVRAVGQSGVEQLPPRLAARASKGKGRAS